MRADGAAVSEGGGQEVAGGAAGERKTRPGRRACGVLAVGPMGSPPAEHEPQADRIRPESGLLVVGVAADAISDDLVVVGVAVGAASHRDGVRTPMDA